MCVASNGLFAVAPRVVAVNYEGSPEWAIVILIVATSSRTTYGDLEDNHSDCNYCTLSAIPNQTHKSPDFFQTFLNPAILSQTSSWRRCIRTVTS